MLPKDKQGGKPHFPQRKDKKYIEGFDCEE